MAEDKLKHLEFIQAIIARQARNTFQVKTWSIALLVGLAGLSRASKQDIFIAGIGAIGLFWALDAYYFSKERKFRELYNDVRKKTTTDFSMNISGYKNWKCGWFGCMIAIAALVPYGAMLIGLILFRFVVR